MTSPKGRPWGPGSRRKFNTHLVLTNATTAQPLAALPPYGCGVPLAGTTLGRGWVPGGSAPYDFRTRSTRLKNGLNLFGAGVNLGPLRPPPAAARAGQITGLLFSHIAPLVCLAFSALLGAFSLFRRARFLHRAMTHIKNAPSSVIAYGDAIFPPVWGRLLGCVLQASPLRGEGFGGAPTASSQNPLRRAFVGPLGVSLLL